eukprot:TRINITY_DN2832_c0_g2_i4.p3 TRINITY_DN2832_c0_g2~~TRINITY_DN2832_c0_g2_i4.p3  ORF type:complete len:127 (+),score=12.19 TRINITY_DN2832_c0_g2_i4:124-504(+)
MDIDTTCFQPLYKYSTVASLSLAKLMPTAGRNAYAMSVVQHPLEDHLFVAATTEHMLGMLDFAKGTLVNSWAAHTGRINSLSFTNIPDDKELANVFFSASEDGFINIWDSRACNMVSNIRTLSLHS